MVIPHYPSWFSCTSFARLRELGGDAFSSDAALSGPDDQGAAPVDPELLVQGGHMVAHRVAGELELRPISGSLLPWQTRVSTSRSRGVRSATLAAAWAGDCPGRGGWRKAASFSTTPRLNQDASAITASMALTSSSSERRRAVMSWNEHRMHARSLKRDGLGGDQAVDLAAAFHPQVSLEVPDGSRPGEFGFEAAPLFIIHPKTKVVRRVPDHVLCLVAQHSA